MVVSCMPCCRAHVDVAFRRPEQIGREPRHLGRRCWDDMIKNTTGQTSEALRQIVAQAGPRAILDCQSKSQRPTRPQRGVDVSMQITSLIIRHSTSVSCEFVSMRSHISHNLQPSVTGRDVYRRGRGDTQCSCTRRVVSCDGLG